MWYVMHGVLWAHCAHNAHRFFARARTVPGGEKTVCSSSPGSSPPGDIRIFLKEAAGVTPWGFPDQFEKTNKINGAVTMYFHKMRVIAMLLAGGQGSRLYVLTRKTAKPAVPFGGKYRIIDFPLSNCVNSGIDTVGILTQYQPLELNEYIGNGQPWGLNKTQSCAQVLPPYERNDKKSGWYEGTANAIYKNIDFVDRFDPDHVVGLSGDHIYKMDYNAMVEYHVAHDAACTIAVRTVPLAEASRFGILNTNPDNSIYEFEEKPKQPKSTNASMGIYCFNWQVLRQALIEDVSDPNSSKDFC